MEKIELRNRTFTRWLIKCGRQRRQLLLRELRSDLVKNGFPKVQLRKALRQLAQQTVVSLERLTNREIDLHTKRRITSDSDYYASYTQKHYKKCYTSSECNKPKENMNEEKHKHEKDQECATYNHLPIKTVNSLKRRCEGSHHTVEKSIGRAKFKKFKDRTETELHKYEKSTHFTTEQYFFDKTNIKNMEKYGDSKGETAKNDSILQLTKERPDSFAGKRTSDASCNIGRDCSFTEEKQKKNSYQDKARFPVDSVNNIHTSKATVQMTEYPSSKNCHDVGRTMLKPDVSKVLKETSVNEQTIATAASTPEIIKGILSRDVSMAQQCHESDLLCDLTSTSSIVAKKSVNMCSSAEFLTSSKKNKSSEQMLSLPLGTFRQEIRTSPNLREDGDSSSSHDNVNARRSNDTKMEQPVALPVSIDLKVMANKVESLTAVTEQKNGAVVTSTIESMKGNSCTLSNKLSTDCDDTDICKSSSKTSVNEQISCRNVQELSENEVEDQESIERSLKLESGVECDRDNPQNVVCVPFMFENNNSIQTQGSQLCEHPNNIHGRAKFNHSTTEDHSKMLTKVELASSSTLAKCDTSAKDNLSFHSASRTQLVKPSSANDKDVAVYRNNKFRLSLENKLNDSATSELKDNIKSSAESEITSPASSTTKTFVEKQDKMSQSLFSGSTNNQSGHATTKRENNSPDGFVNPQISDTVHDIKVQNKTSCLTVQRNTARSPETKEQFRLTPVCRQIPHDSGSSTGKQGSNAENGNKKECTVPLEPSISIEAVDQHRNNGESSECEFVLTKDHSVKHTSSKTKTAGKTEAETLLKRPYIHEERETDSQGKCFKEQSRAPESFKRKLKLSQKFEELFGADECEADSITGEQKNGQKMCKTKNISEVSKEIPQIGNKSTALHTTKQLPGEAQRKLLPSNRGIRVAKKSPLFLCNKTRTICKGQPIGFVSKVKLSQRKEQSLVNGIAKRGSSEETVAGKSQDSERSQSAKEKVMQNWFSDATNPPACSKSRLMTKDTAVNPHNIPWLLKEVDLPNVSIKSRKHYFRQSSVEPHKPVVAKVGLHKRNSFPPMPNNKHAGTDEQTFVREDIFSSPVKVHHRSDTELSGMNVNDKPERRIESCESLLSLETSNVCEEIGALRNAEGERDICTFSEKDVLPDSHKISPSNEKVEIENGEVFLTSIFVKDEEKVLDQNEELVAEPLCADISDIDEKTLQCNNLDTSDAQCCIKEEFSSVESFPELKSVSLKLPNCGHSDAETETGSSPNFSPPKLDPVNSSFGSRNDTKTIESTPLEGGSSCALVVGCGNNLESPEKGSAEKEIMETRKERTKTERLCSEIVHTNESGMSVSTKETGQTSLAGPEVNSVIRTGNKEQGPKELSAVITEEERRDIGTLKGKVNNFSNEASSKARKENLRVIHNATGNESGINKNKQENLRSELQLGENRLQHDDAGAIPNITMADCSPSLKIKIGSIRVKDPLSLGIGCKLSESDAATHLIENSVKSFPTQIENEFTDLASLFVTGFMDIDRYKARMNDAEKLPETSRDIELTCARTDFVHSVRSKCRVVVNKVKFLKFFFPDKFEEVLHAFVNKRWQCTTQELAELYQRFLKEQSKNLSVGTEKSSYTQSEKTKVIVNIEGGNDAPFESQSFVCEVQNSQKHYSKTATAENVGRDQETTEVCIQSGKNSWERTSFTIPSVNRHGYRHSVTEMSPNVNVLSQQSNVVGGSSDYNLTIHQKVLGTDNLTTDTSQVGSQSINKPSEELNDAVNGYHSCNSGQGTSNNVNEGINSSLQPVMTTSDTSLHAKNTNASDIVSSQTERQVTMPTTRSRHNYSVKETSSCTSSLNDNGLMRAHRYHTTQHQPASIQSLQSLIEQMPASQRQIRHNVSERAQVGILSQDQNRLSFPPLSQPQHGCPAPGQPQHGFPAPGQPQHGFPAPGQPQHGFPAPGQPQHGCPAPGQPQHGCPAPGQPQHGCPAPGQPQHGCPAPGQPQHGCPAPGQPQHGCPAPGQPQHGCPAPGQPQHGCPAPGQPQHGCPAPGQPQHGCPAPGQPQHGCPAPGQPQHGCPAPGQPQHGCPAPGQPQHGCPAPGQPQHGCPAPGQPQHGCPAPGQPQHGCPAPGQPQHGCPAPGQPQHGCPAPGQPQHGCPAPGQPQHGCPAPGQPQHGCPAPGQPQHGCPAPGQPQHGCPAPGQPQHGCPAPGQPQHGCPAPGQPQHGCPAPGQPQHGCPAPGQPQHGCPAPGQPQHGCPAPGQPQHGCPAPGQPQHGCPAPGQPQHGCPPQRRAPLPGYLQHGCTPTSQQQHINVTSGQLQRGQISSKSKSVLIRYLSHPKGGALPLNPSQLQEGRMLPYTSQPQVGCRPSYPSQAQARLLPSYQNRGQMEQLLLKQIPQQDSYLRSNHCQLPSYQTQQQYGSLLSSQIHTMPNHITQGQAVNGHQSSNQSLRSSQNLSKTGNVSANQSQTHWAHVSLNSNSVRAGYMPLKQPQVGSIPANVNQPHFESSHVRDLQVKRGCQIPAYVSQLQTGHQTAGQENLNHQQLNRTFQQMSHSTTQASQVSPVHTQATQMIHQRKLRQIAPNFEQTRSMVATVPQGVQLPPYTVHVSQVPANPTNTAVMGHMTANCGMTGLVLSQQIAAVPSSSKVLAGLCFSGAQSVTVQSGTTSTTLISTHQNTFQSAPNVNSIRRQGSSHSEGRIGYQGTETSLPSYMSSSVEDQGNHLSCLAVGQDCGVKETQSADENRSFANLPALGRQTENQQDVRLQCIEHQSNKTSSVIQNNRASNSRSQQKITSTSHVNVIGGSQQTIPSGTQGTGSHGSTVSSAKIITAEPQSAEVIFPRAADSNGVNSQVQKPYRTAAVCEIPNSSRPVICNTMSQNSVAGSSGECSHQQVHISRRHPNILSTQSTNPKDPSSHVSTSAKQSGMLYVTSSENNEVPTNSSVPSLQKAATSQSQLVFRTLGILRRGSSDPAVSVSSTDSLERDTLVTSADKDQHASRVKLPQTVVSNNAKDSSPSVRAEADKLSQQIYTDTIATSASTRTDIIKSGSTSCPAVSPRASVPHDHAPHSHSVCVSSNADSANEGNLLHSVEHPDVLNVSRATGVKPSIPPLTQCDRHTGQSPVTVKDTNTSSTSYNSSCLLQPANEENTEICHNFQASAVQMKIPVSSSDISYSPQLFGGCKTQSNHEKASIPNSVTCNNVSLSSGASSSIGPPIMNCKNNTYLEKLSGAHAMTSCIASVNIVSISAAKTVSSGNGMDTNNSSITEKQGNASSAVISSKEAESCKNLSHQPERTQKIQGNTPGESKTADGANGNMSTVRVETISNTGANKSVAPKTDEVVQESKKQMSEIFDSDYFPAANAVQLKHILTSGSMSNVTDDMEEMDVKEFVESDLSVNSEMSLKLMSRVCFDNKKELTSDSAYLEIMDGRNQCAQTVSAGVNIVNKKNNVPLEKKSGVNIDTPAVKGSAVSEDTALNCATKAVSPGYDADGENSFLTEKRENTMSKLRSPCIVSSRQSQSSDLDNSESEITVVNCLSEDDDIEIIEDCSPVQFLGYKFAKVGVATKTTSRSQHISGVAPADSFTKHISSKSEDISCVNETQEAVGDNTSAKTGSKDTNNETSESQCLKIVSVVSLTSEAMEESEIQWPSSPEPRTVSRDSGYTTPSEGAVHDAQEIHIDGDVHCAFCDNTAQILCTGCYITCYCSADCQARHWREVHYEECKQQNAVGNNQAH